MCFSFFSGFIRYYAIHWLDYCPIIPSHCVVSSTVSLGVWTTCPKKTLETTQGHHRLIFLSIGAGLMWRHSRVWSCMMCMIHPQFFERLLLNSSQKITWIWTCAPWNQPGKLPSSCGMLMAGNRSWIIILQTPNCCFFFRKIQQHKYIGDA